MASEARAVAPVPGKALDALTLVDVLRWRARQHPERSVYTFLKRARDVERTLTFGKLDQRARAIASAIQARTRPGDCAAVICPNDLGFIEAFLGCQYAGVIPVPSPSLQSYHAAERLRRVLDATRPACVVTTSAIEERLKAQADKVPELAALPHLCVDTVPDHHDVLWSQPPIDSSNIAFLQFTSGSLSTPKGVKVSHANIVHNLDLLQHAFGHTQDSRIVSWLPFFHDWGLIGGLLQPIYSGIDSILFEPFEFLRRPQNWLDVISRYGATCSGAPNFAYDQCLQHVTAEDAADLDLAHWQVAIVGAEPIRAETLKQFENRFAPSGFRQQFFFTSYGLAESTLVVTGAERAAPPKSIVIDRSALGHGRIALTAHDAPDAMPLVGCGRALRDQEVHVVDPDRSEICAPMEIGEVWISGPSVAQGYWGMDGENADTFRSRLRSGPETSFLRTGDQGFFHDGDLYITGRIKDLIIVSGRNLYPEDIEIAAGQADPALRAGKGAAFSIDVDGVEQFAVAHEVGKGEWDLDAAVEAIRSAVTGVIGMAPWAVALVKTGGIPRTSSGKVRRQAARQLFLTDELPCLRVWRKDSKD